ncbi:MAG: response regulator [Thiohalocapsa sp.]|nr:response regulator [Thiohalocapsa sp.]
MKILVADDNHILANLLADYLRLSGHEILTTYDGRSASACCRRQRFDAIVIDLLMPDIHGIEVLEELYADGRMPQTILISGFPELLDEIAPRLSMIRVETVIQKPFLFAELDEVLSRLGPSDMADQDAVQAPTLDMRQPPYDHGKPGEPL